MIIRWPKHEDVDQLIEMGARMHAEGAYAFLPYDREKVRRLIVSCIEDPETQCRLVAEEGHVLVGMIAGYLTDYFFATRGLPAISFFSWIRDTGVALQRFELASGPLEST